MGVKRRAFALSDSSEESYDPETESGSIELFAASLDLFRVAPAGLIPMPWPFTEHESSIQSILEVVEKEIRSILKLNGVTDREIESRRISPSGDYGDRETIIVYTPDTDTSTWKRAATQIRLLVQNEATLQNFLTKVYIEIRNAGLMYKDVSHAIRFDSAEHRLFEPMQARVEELVDKHCKNPTSIAYHLRAPKYREEESMPTIVIGIEPGTKFSWMDAYDKIIEGLKMFFHPGSIDFRVELMPGRYKRLVSDEMGPLQPLLLEDLPESPANGASIGPRGCLAAGTLGTWIFFKEGGSDPAYEKQACFLTCYHVVREGTKDEKTRHDKDENGVGLYEEPVGSPIQIMYPAPFDAHHTTKALEKLIKEEGDEEDGRFQHTIALLDEKMTANDGIGNVFRASGYNHFNERGRKMDWAIIRLTDQASIQKNKPVLRSEFREQVPGSVFGLRREQSEVSKVGDPRLKEYVMKRGRNGATIGEVNALFTTVEWIGRPSSKEITILHPDSSHIFARNGDSGSMVHSIDGEWVGMVIGITTNTNATHITSATEIIADVLERTAGDITLP